MLTYIDSLKHNIDERFKECLPVLGAIGIFNPLSLPGKTMSKRISELW